jgi:uncharacterized membrane protein
MSDRQFIDAFPATRPGVMRSALRVILDGALVVVPLGALILLVLGIIRRLQDAADPLAGRFVHPVAGAILLLVMLCAAVGALVRSRPGHWARERAETKLFRQIPGYRMVRAFMAGEVPGEMGERRPRPALAQIEDGLCPALVMERFPDGRVLVFVPGSPAPMSGALYIFTADKVQELDVPLLQFLKAISSWGLGLQELLGKAAAPSERP